MVLGPRRETVTQAADIRLASTAVATEPGEHYLAKEERRLRKKTRGLTAQARRALLRFAWPGNVRDVESACAALVVNTPAGAEIDILEKQCREPPGRNSSPRFGRRRSAIELTGWATSRRCGVSALASRPSIATSGHRAKRPR